MKKFSSCSRHQMRSHWLNRSPVEPSAFCSPVERPLESAEDAAEDPPPAPPPPESSPWMPPWTAMPWRNEAPLGVPGNVVARLHAGMVEVVNTAEMKKVLNNQGLEAQTNTPQQFGAFIRGEIAENAKLIKVMGLKAE